MVGLFVKLWCVIRVGSGVIVIVDVFVGINVYNVVIWVFMYSGSWVIFGVDRVCIVVVGNGKCISKYVIVDFILFGWDEIFVFDFIDVEEMMVYF